MSLDEMLSRRPNPAGVVRNLNASPIEHVAIVTCMDARIAAFSVFGLRIGDAHIIRNAGGTVTSDVIRSLAISQRKLGTRNILLMAHTGCGMLSFTDDEFIAELAQDTGQPPTWRPGTFTDPIQHVRHGMAQLHTSPFLHPETLIRGFVFNLDSGAVDEVTELAETLAVRAAQPAALGSANTGSANTGSANTGSANTGSANTGSAKAGSAKTGSAKAGSAKAGSAKAGSAKAGSNGFAGN